MASERSKSFSLVFLATATLLLVHAGAAAPRSKKPSRDICMKASYAALCRSVVKAQKSPYLATQTTVKYLIGQTTAMARKAAAAKGKDMSEKQALSVCRESYDDALSCLQESLANMKSRDKGSFDSNLSAVVTDFVTCNDAFDEMGVDSPLIKSNEWLSHIADNGLFLATQWH